MTPEERQHEDAVNSFFKRAVKDGRMTEQEMQELTGNERRGCGRRSARGRALKVFEDFVIAACNSTRAEDEPGITEMQKASMRVYIDLRLKELGLTRRHVELYINYPEWTETELGQVFKMPRRTVAYQLDRVRRSWSGLRLDTPVRGRDEAPALEHMDRIECSDTTDWLDENAIRQKF